MEVSHRHGGLATDPPVRIGPFGIRALSIPLGGQPFGFIGRDWVHELWVPILHIHHNGIHTLLQLPVPNAVLAPDSLRSCPGYSALAEPPTNLWIQTGTSATQDARGSAGFTTFDERCWQKT